jgi:hypothetical protein
MARQWNPPSVLDYLFGPSVSDKMAGQTQTQSGQNRRRKNRGLVEVPGDDILVTNNDPNRPGIPRDDQGDSIVERNANAPVPI